MTTKQFIYNVFASKQTKFSCSSVFADVDREGRVTVYSYGWHYPLATILNGKGYVNTSGYSATTSKHIAWAFAALEELIDGDSYGVETGDFTIPGITKACEAKIAHIKAEMASKKRKDTQVYRWLEFDLQKNQEALASVR